MRYQFWHLCKDLCERCVCWACVEGEVAVSHLMMYFLII